MQFRAIVCLYPSGREYLWAQNAIPRYRYRNIRATGVSAYKLFNETIIINGVTKEIKR
jgi:hypothetical protein